MTSPGKSTAAQIDLERTPPPCDRCRNPALTMVEKLTTIFEKAGYYSQKRLQLSFCGHHFSDLEVQLAIAGWVLVADTRAQLATREAVRRVGGPRW